MTATVPGTAALGTVPGSATCTAMRPSTGARPRTFLMCPPTHFAVEYAINVWMDPSRPVDIDLALAQWAELRATYLSLGHTVHVIDAAPDLPDMVYAANGAFSVGGVVYGAKFAHAQRSTEASLHAAWYARAGWPPVVAPRYVNEGEGDFAYVPGRNLVLAGTGFRTDPRAHSEAQDALGRPVVTLRLVDSRFYHLDTALFVLDDHTVCYYPGAFSRRSQHVLHDVFPDAVIATEADALAFGLNAVSDGHHVVLARQAGALADRLAARGYEPVPVDLSELTKGGGNVKCCTAELRA